MVDKEHILKLKRGDIALIVNSDDGWFKKMSIAFADDHDDSIQMSGDWISLYKAVTHLSMICDTYLRSRQNLIQEDGHDLLAEQEWNQDMLDPYILGDYLNNLGYTLPPELQKEIDEQDEQELKKEPISKDNVIQLFPEK